MILLLSLYGRHIPCFCIFFFSNSWMASSRLCIELSELADNILAPENGQFVILAAYSEFLSN